MLLSKSSRHLTQAEVTRVAQVVIVEKRHRPRRAVRGERAIEHELLLVSVRVLGEKRVEIPVRPQRGGMKKLDGIRAPLDAVIEAQRQLAAGAEEVLLCDVEVERGDASVVGEVSVDVRGKGVLRHDCNIDQAIMWRSRGDRRALQEIELSEISLRLLELCRIERIAFLEEKEAPQQRDTCPHGEDVRFPIKAAVTRFLGAEERNGLDADFSDAQWGVGDREQQVQ